MEEKVFIKINCEMFLKELFKDLLRDIKPINIYEHFEKDKSYLIIECYNKITLIRRWHYQIDEYLTQQQFNDLNVSDYDLRNDLMEE